MVDNSHKKHPISSERLLIIGYLSQDEPHFFLKGPPLKHKINNEEIDDFEVE